MPLSSQSEQLYLYPVYLVIDMRASSGFCLLSCLSTVIEILRTWKPNYYIVVVINEIGVVFCTNIHWKAHENFSVVWKLARNSQ